MDPLSFVLGMTIAAAAGMLWLGVAWMIRPWLRLAMCGGKASLVYILAMRLRGTPAMLVVDAYVALLHSGANVSLRDVESHYVANRVKIISAGDLVDSMRKDPLDTHLAVWLDDDDVQWLAEHCSTISNAHNEGAANAGVSPEDADAAARIARKAKNVLCKLDRIQTRRNRDV